MNTPKLRITRFFVGESIENYPHLPQQSNIYAYDDVIKSNKKVRVTGPLW